MELYILLCLAAIIVVLEIIILAGSRKSGKSDGLEQKFRHMEGYVADEFQRNRKETADSLKDMNQLIREMQQMNAGITAATAAAGTGGLLLLLVFPEKERVIFQCLHILCAA